MADNITGVLKGRARSVLEYKQEFPKLSKRAFTP